MIRHWLTIAWRAVRGDPVFAAISILSLAIGCAGALLVGAYAREEATWDWWVPASSRMVTLETIVSYPGRPPSAVMGAQAGLAPVLAREAPGLEGVTRSIADPLPVVRVGDRTADIPFGEFVDPDFFRVIELSFAEGDPAAALSDPSGVVLSYETRESLFGKEAALGRTIQIGDGQAVVTGVLAKLPRNTSLYLPLVAPMASPFRDPSYIADPDSSFSGGYAQIYLRAESRAAARAWKTSLPPLLEDVLARNAAAAQGGASIGVDVVPFRQMRTARSAIDAGGAETARLRLMIVVAGALLFVSAFNYVSLSLARVVRRTREVGLRKAMGADRGDLVRQHLAESAAFTALALLLGFALAEAVRPWIAQAMNMRMDAEALRNPAFLGLALAGGAVVAVLVAAYPAVFLAGLRPAAILQGRSGPTRALAGAIYALVAIQFAAATGLVASVAVFHAQAAFLASAPLGYATRDRVVARAGFTSMKDALASYRTSAAERAQRNISQLTAIKAALAGAPGVLSVSGTGAPPLTGYADQMLDLLMTSIALPGAPPEAEPPKAFRIQVDLEHLADMEVTLLAGRLFDAGFGTDRAMLDNPGVTPPVTPAVVTRRALQILGAGAPEEAVGRRARFVYPGSAGGDPEIEVVGVIDDWYFRSLKYAATPVIFTPDPGSATYIVAQIDGAQREAAVAAIEKAMASVSPGAEPDVTDLQTMADDLYREETRWRRLVTGAAVLAVGVACLGLYGLTAFSAGQRRHEVGVRKSLGADEGQVLVLMLARFARPVLVGVAVGWGAAFYAMAGWLAGFARHAALTPAPFVAAGAAALAVAAAAALFHALRAARTSPAVVLRTE